MGSYGGLGGDHAWQLLISGVKVPLLLFLTFLIGLPNFFVLNTLFGLRRDFREALRALLAAQAGVAIVLASCAPLTLFWYASCATTRPHCCSTGWSSPGRVSQASTCCAVTIAL